MVSEYTREQMQTRSYQRKLSIYSTDASVGAKLHASYNVFRREIINRIQPNV